VPISYAIDAKQRYVYTTVSGTIDLTEVLNHRRDLLADPAFAPDMPELADARTLKVVDFPPSSLSVVVQQDLLMSERMATTFRVALLLEDDRFFDLARGYERLSMPYGNDVAVFRDLESARRWLGLE
jgi:hypothetical protein